MHDSPERDDERQPLDRIKPPREWRSRRRPQPGRRTAPGGAPGRPGATAQRQGPAAAPTKSKAPQAPPPPAARRVPGRARDRIRELLAPHPTAPRVPGELHPLPARYHEDRITLLIRDPRWCFAWWELTPVSRAQRAVPPDQPPVLRFYDVTWIHWDGHNHHDSRDIVVHGDVGDWYVELGRPGASFIAELGLRDARGAFVPLARSNRIDMPRAGPSPDVDPAWPPVSEGGRLQLSEDALAALESSGALSSGAVSSGAWSYTAAVRRLRDESP